MKSFSELAQSVKFSKKGFRIVLNDHDSSLKLIGTGRSAFVFKIKSSNKVLKIYFPTFSKIAKEEAEIYQVLSGNPYYPNIYDWGTNYIVIDYISGDTLFNCLLKGIRIKNKHIKEIDYALSLAKESGLNPSDIHLKNIMITPDGSIKIIDVARFRQSKKCSQWVDLKIAFYRYYKHKIFPKRFPEFFLNFIAFLYKKNLLPIIS